MTTPTSFGLGTVAGAATVPAESFFPGLVPVVAAPAPTAPVAPAARTYSWWPLAVLAVLVAFVAVFGAHDAG